MVGKEIHIHDVSSAGFSEKVYLSVTLKSRADLASLCSEISGGGSGRWRIKVKGRKKITRP